MDITIAEAWLDLFQKDNWEIGHTYATDTLYWTCKKNGWTAHVNLRDKCRDANRVHVWAPDGLAIIVTDTPNIGLLEAALRYCVFCNAANVDTVRVSFAGRCCKQCRSNKEFTAKMEYPGWAN